MKRYLFPVIIFISMTLPAFSQAGFRPGFIVKNNGDTLNGLVYYSVEGRFENTCRFKRFEIARDFTYTPHALKGFGFEGGRCFETKKTGNRKRFFECLLKGEISVYVKPGKVNGKIYLDSPATGFFRLSEGKNQPGEAGSFNSFKEILEYLLRQSGTSVSLASVKYDAGQIVSAIGEGCRSMQVPPHVYCRTPRVRYLSDYSLTASSRLYKFGLNSGYQFLNIKIPGDQYSDYFSEAQYNSTYRPVTGLFINRRLSRKSGLFSVELGLNYLSDTYYGYAEYTDGAVIDRNDIYIDISSIQVPLFLKISFGKRKSHPYLKAGGYKSFLIRDSYRRLSEHQFNNEIYTEEFSDFDLEGDVGMMGGAGIEFDLGSARSLGFDALYMWGGHLMLSDRSLVEKTTLEAGGFGIMMHINF